MNDSPFRSPGREPTENELREVKDDGTLRLAVNRSDEHLTITGMYGQPFVEGVVTVPPNAIIRIWRDDSGWHCR